MERLLMPLVWQRRLHYWSDDPADSLLNDSIYCNESALNYSRPNPGDNLTSFLGSHVDPTIVIYSTSFLIVFCTVSLTANIVILSSVCFMRTRVHPTLYISLSLAGADTFSLFLFALGLVLFTLLPRGFGIVFQAPCVSLVIEALRMGAILTNMFHLVALAGNHYLGILKPLKYPVFMTRRNLRYITLMLWTIPSTLLIINIFIVEGAVSNSCSPGFLKRAKFRTTFAIPFFTTLGLMMFIYCHIYMLVDKHQKNTLAGKYQKHRSQKHRMQCSNSSYTKSQVNKKVIVTTLMILGSVVFGWLPAFTYFILCCEDCLLKHLWQLQTLHEHIVLVFINFLMISKTATNSYIYACRMKELKASVHLMTKTDPRYRNVEILFLCFTLKMENVRNNLKNKIALRGMKKRALNTVR